MVNDQFPEWADEPIKPVAQSGWDNRTFHLGDRMSVRLPSASRYVAQVPKEQKWLPHLANFLPLPIPQPIALGQPSKHYPYCWSIMSWLQGRAANIDNLADSAKIAEQLAHFLNALRAAPADNGPITGKHNFYRGGDLRIYDQEVRHSLDQLGDKIDGPAILELWTKACNSSWTEPPVWLHGDVAAGNFLTDGDALAAVVDFGNLGVGDPACDLTITWTYLTGDARAVFRRTIGLDDATWTRAKGWGIWKALLDACAGKPAAQDVLNTILSDPG